MEIINNNYNPAGGPTSSNGRPSGPDNQARNLFFGTLLVAAGFLWLLRDFHVVPYWLFNTIFSWQMLLAVTGAYLLTIRRWIVGSMSHLQKSFFRWSSFPPEQLSY